MHSPQPREDVLEVKVALAEDFARLGTMGGAHDAGHLHLVHETARRAASLWDETPR